jgi:multiple sugar transport system permease protein
MRIRQKGLFYGVFLPITLFLFAVTVFPMIYSLGLSFLDINLLKPYRKSDFILFDNFKTLITSARFNNSVINTAIFTLSTLLVEFLLGLGIALLLNREIAARRFFRTLFLIPFMTTPVVVGLIWRFLFNYDLGLINYLFRSLHLKGVLWLSDPALALRSIIIVDIWQWTPFVALILLSGLQSIPIEPFESSKIDGCSKLQEFYYLTLYFLRPSILVVVLIRTMDSIKLYDLVYTLTEGGPGIKSETISFFLYILGFKQFFIGQSSAGSYLLLVVLTLLSMAFIRLFRGEYEGGKK